jgi:hypothetical protein
MSEAGYHRNLAIVRTAADAAGIPFWNFFGAMPYGGKADLSEAQLRWQVCASHVSVKWRCGLVARDGDPTCGRSVFSVGVQPRSLCIHDCMQVYTSLAYGARGLLYFCYWCVVRRVGFVQQRMHVYHVAYACVRAVLCAIVCLCVCLCFVILPRDVFLCTTDGI